MMVCALMTPLSGYVIVCALMRAFEAMSVERAIKSFAEGRGAGIYKNGLCPLPCTVGQVSGSYKMLAPACLPMPIQDVCM